MCSIPWIVVSEKNSFEICCMRKKFSDEPKTVSNQQRLKYSNLNVRLQSWSHQGFVSRSLVE